MIGFNKPYITGKEFDNIQAAIKFEKLSGNGHFTKLCHDFFENKYGFKKTLLTHSCTAALEMAAILIDINPGDEVIIPAYTFVSTANAFVLNGAKVVFADSNELNPNVSPSHISSLITKKTKAIVVVHYAGVACDMDAIMELANAHNLYVIEDAAQAIDSYYKGRPLGSIGHLAAFSFHETKNIISGEGGMLVVNDSQFIERSEIIWEKGTNRSAFSRGIVDKYRWVDKGSSFLPSELTAAFLYAQLECLDFIQQTRKHVWLQYYSLFSSAKIKNFGSPHIDEFATNNAHLFYLLTASLEERDNLLAFLKAKNIQAVFHYLPLHQSPYFEKMNGSKVSLPFAEKYGCQLIRLPFYTELATEDIEHIVKQVISFYTLKYNERFN